MLKRSAHVKKLSFVFSINLLVLLAAARGQNVATAAVPKQLTIEQIFAAMRRSSAASHYDWFTRMYKSHKTAPSSTHAP